MRRLELGPQMLLLIKSLQNEGIAEAMRERSSSHEMANSARLRAKNDNRSRIHRKPLI
jgi:hypothetical protein